jgi:hypothetical protein
LSFRDSLSNPYPLPEGQRPIFAPGDDWVAVDTTKLPSGSVVYDNDPVGHVSVVGVTPEIVASAVVDRGKLPR